MAKILFATVPLSGHVNPGIPLAKRLTELGHEVWWYCGSAFRDRISASGARFISFDYAPEFNDQTVAQLHGPVPTRSLLANAAFYARYVFFQPMPAYYLDLKKILSSFNASILVSDEWFSGGIPFSEKKILPWVIYGNSPLMMMTANMPAPGSGLMPDNSIYGKHRDFLVKLIARRLFMPIQHHINQIRKDVGLGKMRYCFFEQNMRNAALCLKFNTRAFEFPYPQVPDNLYFVGPVLPSDQNGRDFPWLENLPAAHKDVVLITQGSVDVYDIRKLIVPALRALKNENILTLVSTGGKNVEELRKQFKGENVIIEPYIPYAKVMDHVKLMITNGGFGGVSTALFHGVPLIVAGNSEDKPEVASRVVYTGCGIDMNTGKPSPAKLRKAVMQILEEASYREAAMKISEDYRKHNAVDESIFLMGQLLHR